MNPPDGDGEIGCRSALLTGAIMLGAALVIGGVGLSLILSRECAGICEQVGLTLFYAAAPSSALFGVIGGGLPIAWPVDAGIWLVLGTMAASWAGRRRSPTWHPMAALGLLALLYGLVLSRFVEVNRLSG